MNEANNLLENKKERLKNLVLEMLEELPQPIASMSLVYRSLVLQLIDNLTDEQMTNIVDKVKELIDYVEGGDTHADSKTYRTK